MHSVQALDSMQPRLLSFWPGRELGITLYPRSCEVACVDKDKAAYWAGVSTRWVIVLIDGSFVGPTSAKAAIAEIKTNKKRKRPWKILFLKPGVRHDVLGERLDRSRPWFGTNAHGLMSRRWQEMLAGSHSFGFRPHQQGAKRKPERPVAGNEKLIRFCSFNKLGFTLKNGTPLVASVSNDGPACWEGVCEGWKIMDINGERVNTENVSQKLCEAKEREVFFTVRFLKPSPHALLYKIKKVLMEPVGNATLNYRLKKQSSVVSKAASVQRNQRMNQLLFMGVNESMCDFDGVLEQPKRRWSKEPSMEPIEEYVEEVEEENDGFTSSNTSCSRDSGDSLSFGTQISLSDQCRGDISSDTKRHKCTHGELNRFNSCDEKEM